MREVQSCNIGLENIRPGEEPHNLPRDLIKEWLTAMGFSLSARKASAYTTLNRVLLKNAPTQNEVMVLEAILQQNIRKLNKLKKIENQIKTTDL